MGISGASGVVYGVRLLEALQELKIERHLIMTPAAQETLRLETDYHVEEVESMATKSYQASDLAAPPASGSFLTDGMAVIPCSMKTLGGIAHGFADNLLLRAAEVNLKERRPLVLVPRETPLTLIHLENMVAVARAGAIVLPAMPAFYHKPQSIGDLLVHVVGKVLDVFRISHNLYRRWQGPTILSAAHESSPNLSPSNMGKEFIDH